MYLISASNRLSYLYYVKQIGVSEECIHVPWTQPERREVLKGRAGNFEKSQLIGIFSEKEIEYLTSTKGGEV